MFPLYELPYLRDEKFQSLLRGCREQPDERTGPLVLADWLDEWAGDGVNEFAQHATQHAAFIRRQCDGEYYGRVVKLKGRGRVVTENGRVDHDSMMFYRLILEKPWEHLDKWGEPACMIVNAGDCGVCYRHGLPFSVKCGVQTLDENRDFITLWQLPAVFTRVPRGHWGVLVAGMMEDRTAVRLDPEIHVWWSRQGYRAELPAPCRRTELVERGLYNALRESVPNTRFIAVEGRDWHVTQFITIPTDHEPPPVDSKPELEAFV